MLILGTSGHVYYSKFSQDKIKFAEFKIPINRFDS